MRGGEYELGCQLSRFAIRGLTSSYIISSILSIKLFRGELLLLFFPKLKISMIHRAATGFCLQGPTVPAQASLNGTVKVSLKGTIILFQFHSYCSHLSWEDIEEIQPSGALFSRCLFYLSLQFFRLSFASFLVSLPFRFSEAAVIMGVLIYHFLSSWDSHFTVGFFLGIH